MVYHISKHTHRLQSWDKLRNQRIASHILQMSRKGQKRPARPLRQLRAYGLPLSSVTRRNHGKTRPIQWHLMISEVLQRYIETQHVLNSDTQYISTLLFYAFMRFSKQQTPAGYHHSHINAGSHWRVPRVEFPKPSAQKSGVKIWLELQETQWQLMLHLFILLQSIHVNTCQYIEVELKQLSLTK